MRGALYAATAALCAVSSLAQSSSDASSMATSSRASSSDSTAATFDGASSFGSIRTITGASASLPTGSYASFATVQSTVMTASNSSSNSSRTTQTSSSNSLLLVGGGGMNATATSTTSARPTNTQACNNHPEFCNRKYMNFTEVCAHNSAFHKARNLASNQQYDIVSQLNDGVRMIQGEVHWVNDTLYACHTSCDLLNGGTFQDELTTVATWVKAHPYDVVTVLIVNSDYRNVSDYIAPIQNSGIAEYAYIPPKVPMHRDDWPTLGNMILQNKRVVIFMDYQANQTEYPQVLDEFTHIWETPFSPTNISFPCDQQRPPGLNNDQIHEQAYLANHNLNAEISLGSESLLIPDISRLDQVNSVNGIGSNGTTGALGTMADQCRDRWNYPPAWLLVDFYNYGDFPGSVFQVAADLNGVNYTGRSTCCGNNDSVSAAARVVVGNAAWVVGSVVLAAVVGTWGWLS